MGVGYYLATRDPYPVRVFNRGGDAYERGDFVEAERFLTRAIETSKSKPLLADAFFWRARTRLQQSRNFEAIEDFKSVAELRRNGRVFACLAYAWARQRLFTNCVNWSLEAIKAGFKTAEAYNNQGVGYCCTDEFPAAIEALDNAIQRKPGLQSALHNRAWAEFRCAQRQGRALDPRARKDIDRVLRSDPEDPFAFYDAALIYEQLGDGSDMGRSVIVQFLCDAVRKGIHPGIVRRNFRFLIEVPELKRLLASSRQGLTRNVANFLADPVADQPFPFR
jgi:tetratricopeptide (TPR) repeat protein